jgi:hypothetical protein
MFIAVGIEKVEIFFDKRFRKNLLLNRFRKGFRKDGGSWFLVKVFYSCATF